MKVVSGELRSRVRIMLEVRLRSDASASKSRLTVRLRLRVRVGVTVHTKINNQTTHPHHTDSESRNSYQHGVTIPTLASASH